MMVKITYDPRYQPSAETLEKLRLSRLEVENMPKRDLNCPICGFRIEGVYSDCTGHPEVKCRKCKFEGPLNLAYFRRQRRHHRSIRFPSRRRGER